MKRDEFSFGNAFNLRTDDALKAHDLATGGDGSASAGRDKLWQDAADRIVAQHGEKVLTVEYMRSVGGWTHLVEAVVGEAPDPHTNEIGMARNPAWYLWTVAKQNPLAVKELALKQIGR